MLAILTSFLSYRPEDGLFLAAKMIYQKQISKTLRIKRLQINFQNLSFCRLKAKKTRLKS